jgi:hypothetical protein
MISLARPCLAVGVVFFGLLLSAGCKRDNGPDTGIIVEVTTDLRVPGDINQVHLTAKDSQGNILHEETFDLGEGPNRVLPPFRVGIYPLHDTATPIHIGAVGQLDTDSQPVVSRSATLSFIQGQKVVLVLPLLAVCRPVRCTATFQTCKENGKCEPDDVVSTSLPPYVPNQPVPEPDAATVIPDAQTSVAPMDAAAEKTADSAAADRTGDLAPEVAGGRDAFSATGGAGGTDAPSATGGTGGATAAVDARTEVGNTTGADAPPDVPVGGSGGMGGTPATGGTSCSGLAATCGPSGNDDCCTSLLVPGGTFYRSYDGVDFTDKSYPATVADFYLDKYEITVGRFRAFVNAGMGTQASPPASGAGAIR